MIGLSSTGLFSSDESYTTRIMFWRNSNNAGKDKKRIYMS